MERKIGKLGIAPVEAVSIGHNGSPGTNGGAEYYLKDKLNLNIVYSVYFTPRTREEIAEELGLSKDSIKRAKKALEKDMHAIISKKKATIAENGWYCCLGSSITLNAWVDD